MVAPFHFDYAVPEHRLVIRAWHDGKALVRIELRARRGGSERSRPSCQLERRLAAALRRYFAGEPVVFSAPLAWHGRPAREHGQGGPPPDAHATTPFQRAVWDALRRIPHGEVRTYGWVAKAIGRPRAARAVGAACRANPWPIIVPCHRVIAADGSLGGYSAGLKWKRVLLALEGASREP